ncbi:MAG: hypothetical protein ABSD71_13045 [Bacteroidales bacterium]
MELTAEDIKKLKYEKRIGYVFSAIIFSFGGLFNVIYFCTPLIELKLIFILIIDLLILIFGYLICFFMNKGFTNDLKSNKKKDKIERIVRKEEIIDYEAGSGTLDIPILSNLFPKLFRRAMRPIKILYLVIDNNRYPVDESFYNSVNEDELVIMYYSEYSETLLGFKKK